MNKRNKMKSNMETFSDPDRLCWKGNKLNEAEKFSIRELLSNTKWNEYISSICKLRLCLSLLSFRETGKIAK
jgi:hypothetical protein